MKKVFLFFSDPYTRCQYWLDEGLKLKNLKKYPEAIECFDEVLKINHQNPEAWYQKGLTLAESDPQKNTEALACYDQTLNFNPQHKDAWYNKGLLLKKFSNDTEAVKCFDSVLQLDPQNIKVWNYKGLSLSKLGKTAEAIKHYEYCLNINPQYKEAWVNKSISLKKQGKNKEAIKCFDSALQLDPNYITALNQKGLTLQKLGEVDKAIKCFDKILEINPKNKDIRMYKGRILEGLGKYEETIECCDTVLKIDPNNKEVCDYKGFILCYQRNFSVALTFFNRALQIDANYLNALNNKAYVLLYQKQFNEAEICFEKALSQNPNFSSSLQGKGLIAYQKQELELANEYFQKAEALLSSTHKVYELCVLYCRRGTAFVALNDLEKAKEVFKKAIDLNPNYIPARNELKKITQLKPNKTSILKSNPTSIHVMQVPSPEPEIEKILAAYHETQISAPQTLKKSQAISEPAYKKPSYLPLVSKLRLEGQKLQGSQQYIEAIKLFDQALEIDSNDAIVWKSKGESLAKLGRNIEATQCFNEAIRCLDNLLKLNPKDIYKLEMKGKVLIVLGEYHAALDCFNQVFKIESNLSPTHMCQLFYYQGKAFVGLNELDKAREAFNKALALDPKYIPAKQELKKLQSTHPKSNTLQQQRLEKIVKENQELDEELKKLQIEDEELEKKLKTHRTSEPNKKRTFVKPKPLLQTQENPEQLLQETPQESQQHLEKELHTLKQQLQNSAQRQSELEQKIQSLQTASVKNSELSNLKKELVDLKNQQAKIQAEREIKAARLAAEAKFKTQPNLWLFYRITCIHLENRFLGAKDIESGFPELGYKGKVGDVATGINIFSKFLSLIPAIGNSLDTVVSVATTGLEKIDEERITNILKAVAELGTLTEIKRAAESTARQLTERYSDQLNQLATENKKPTSNWEKIKEGGKSIYETTKEFVIKEQATSPPKELAEFAVSQIVSALLDLSIKPDQPLDAQFVQAVCAPPSRLEKIKHAVTGVLGLNEIETKDGKTWQLQNFYRKPGIRTAEGECYVGEGAEPELYGYRLGTREEAELLQWKLVSTVKEIKQPELAKETPPVPTKIPNSYAIVNAQFQEQPTLPPAHKHEVEELRQQLKAEAEARKKHETDLRELKELQERENARREAELRALKSKMSKLLQDQGDTSSDVDLGNQLQLKAQSQANQRSPRMDLSNAETSGMVVEHDQRLSKLEQITALWMETEKSESTNTENNEDSTRNELFSQHSKSKR